MEELNKPLQNHTAPGKTGQSQLFENTRSRSFKSFVEQKPQEDCGTSRLSGLAEIRSRTAHGMPSLKGRTPYEIVTGDTHTWHFGMVGVWLVPTSVVLRSRYISRGQKEAWQMASWCCTLHWARHVLFDFATVRSNHCSFNCTTCHSWWIGNTESSGLSKRFDVEIQEKLEGPNPVLGFVWSWSIYAERPLFGTQNAKTQ